MERQKYCPRSVAFIYFIYSLNTLAVTGYFAKFLIIIATGAKSDIFRGTKDFGNSI